MDGFMRLLWSSSNSASTQPAIPQYHHGDASHPEDVIDLQIKSLLYMYRRYGGFHQSLAAAPAALPAELTSEKLDHMYNRARFDQLLNHDEHRILADWHKNRFRSYCILSSQPQELKELPRFPDPAYQFVVLEAGASGDEFVKALCNSPIYIEHAVPMGQRLRLAKLAVELHQLPAVSRSVARWKIIDFYLKALAVHVQVERLYRAQLRDKLQRSPTSSPRSPSPQSSRASSRNASPERLPDSPTRKHSDERATSPGRRPPSPLRLSDPPSSGKPRTLHKSASTANLKVNFNGPLNSAGRSPVKLAPPVGREHRGSPGSPPSPTKLRPSNRLLAKGSVGNLHTMFASGTAVELDASLRKDLTLQARRAVEHALEKERAVIGTAN